LKSITGAEMCRLIEVNGWSLRRLVEVTISIPPGERKIIPIPVHGGKNLKPGLAFRIARDAGVNI
jgi:predicted RNA binding protein YcfA (HicA-like mRNA interferase family)